MTFKQIRDKIDTIDNKILDLLNKRAGFALSIKDLKNKNKLNIYSPDRESQVLEKIKKKNKGPLTSKSVTSIFREIISSCLSLQKPLKIAYLGPALSFTHQASVNKFGKDSEYISCSNISFIFDEVEHLRADYGVVPIENSTEGMINHTLDMFIESNLKITSEMLFEIHHYLLSLQKDIRKIKKIYSKSEVFGQCRKWIEEKIPQAELIGVNSTSEAANLASKEKDSAAVASKAAAEKYNLNILARKIQDYKDNQTRFLIIGREYSKVSGNDKTSIMFSVKDKVGALHDILVPFKKCGINLTKIESRPSKEKLWEYYFFVDFQGHYKERKIKEALEELNKNCSYLKVLGSYPYEME